MKSAAQVIGEAVALYLDQAEEGKLPPPSANADQAVAKLGEFVIQALREANLTVVNLRP
jgi:hypothetical protein